MYHPGLVPIDGGTTAHRGVHAAIGLAAELESSLRTIHDLGRALDRLRRQSEDLLAIGTHRVPGSQAKRSHLENFDA